MADSATEFVLFWEDRSNHDLTADRLARLPFDFASWSNLLAVTLGRASYADMTARPPGQKPVRCKVMLAKDLDGASRESFSFENMKPG